MVFNDLDLNGTYSYADYLKWTFEERLELLRGKIFKMSPAPASKHQLIVGEIHYQIKKHLRHKSCQVFLSPFDVRLSPRRKEANSKVLTVVQPDVCVVCDLSKIDKNGCVGAPDLVVEVLSPGNTGREMKDKYEIYEENGVKEYWLVEPNDKIVLVYVLNEQGRYVGLKPFTETEILTSAIIKDFAVPVSEIFDVGL
jgi:Uma2 family endonuclease